MKRIRFEVNGEDYRPISWPIKHPYWCTGTTMYDTAILVSYADDEDYIKKLWPEAKNLEVEEAESYIFTDRFPRPDWFKEAQK